MGIRNHFFLSLSSVLVICFFAAGSVFAKAASDSSLNSSATQTESVTPTLGVSSIPPGDIVPVMVASVGQPDNVDPYEHYNRNAYRFNMKLDKNVLKPVAQGYKAVTPSIVRTGVSHFFNNIAEIPRFTNDVLQANFYWAMNDMWRFLINTTVGIGGIFDVAQHMGLQTHRNSFSFTLESWGAKPSPYTVLPFFGPSVLYNVYGIPMDFYLNPLGSTIGTPNFGYAMFILNVVNLRASFLQNEDFLDQVALDQYVFIRNAYLQAREKQLYLNNNPPVSTGVEKDELYTGD